MFGDFDILSIVRVSWLNWIGHVCRMDNNRRVSQGFNNNNKSIKEAKVLIGLQSHWRKKEEEEDVRRRRKRRRRIRFCYESGRGFVWLGAALTYRDFLGFKFRNVYISQIINISISRYAKYLTFLHLALLHRLLAEPNLLSAWTFVSRSIHRFSNLVQ
jgi:hypothetical protein